MELIDQIPGLRDAVFSQNRRRELVFLDVPQLLDVGSAFIPVRPLTPNIFLILDAVESPIVRGLIPSPSDLAIFLWIISVEHRPMEGGFWSRMAARWKRKRFYKSCREFDYVTTWKACHNYITEPFIDGPSSHGEPNPAPPVSWCAEIVSIITTSFQWPESIIMDLPFVRIFQYIRCIQLKKDPKTIFIDPADSIRGAWLRELNTAKKN